MISRLRNEDGWAVVTALLLMTIMLGMGLAAFTFVDTQQRESGLERSRESAFNLAEGALDSSVFILSRRWPGTIARAFPTCTEGSSDAACPDPSRLRSEFSNVDYAPGGTYGATWITSVRDNGNSAANFYNDQITATQPSWDANGDGRLWVRAQATARAKTRTLIALVKVEQHTEAFPRNTILAGKVATTNNGKKVIIDTQGPSAQPGPLKVRCASPLPPLPVDLLCLGFNFGKGQVAPMTVSTGYGGGAALSAEAIDRLRATAEANGTYYATGCPTNPSGAVVFVENGDCTYNNSTGAVFNSETEPGIFIVNNGTFSINGNSVFYGIVYAINAQGTTGNVISINGTASIQGAAAVDGSGGLIAGSSKVNVVFDDRVFNHIRSYGTAGIVQNTWREVQG